MAPPNASVPATPRVRVWGELLLILHLAFLTGLVVAARVDSQASILPVDHGRELYCFSRVAAGEVPYRDFQWVYSPLMLYFYGGMLRLFGENLLVVRSAFLGLHVLAAAFAFLGARRAWGTAAGHAIALLVLLWGTPPHSYSHMALGVAVAAGMWGVSRAFEPGAPPRAALATIFLAGAVAGLAKWSSGVAWIFSAGLALLLRVLLLSPAGEERRRRVRELCFAAGGGLAVIVAGHAVLLAGLPASRLATYRTMVLHPSAEDAAVVTDLVRLPALAFDRSLSWGDALRSLRSPLVVLPFLLLVAATAGAVWALVRARQGRPWDAAAVRLLGLWSLALLMSHEFLARGSTYSLCYLGLVPLLFLLAALLERQAATWRRTVAPTPATAAATSEGRAADAERRPGLRRCALVGTAAWLLLSTAWVVSLAASATTRDPGARLFVARGGGVWIGSARMREELEAVAGCLERITKPDEPVAVLPCDLLVSFLAGRRSPFYVSNVGWYYHLDERAEEEMIAQLEAGPVRCVVLTNNAVAPSTLWGQLGHTHLRKLAAHVREHYDPVAYFGFDAWGLHNLNWTERKQSIVYWRKNLPKPSDLPR